MKMPYRRRAWWIGGLVFLTHFGCAATPYRYGQFHGPSADTDPPRRVVIEYGQPNKTLDRIAWVAGMPARIFPLSAKINNHQLSSESAETLKAYLEKNDLTDVNVYVNHYDPSGQWRRLRENDLVSPVWRYSFGVFSFVGYTVLPNRVFGGDKYNPYTNSLYLNSDVPAVALHEAAFAKDIHARKRPGTYAAINDIPGLSLWRRSLAIGDVLGYARSENDWETERQTYRVLYPRMGAESTAVAAPLVGVWWAGPALGLGGAVVGHVAGRTLTARRDAELHDSTSPVEKPTSDVQQAEFTQSESPKSERAEPMPVRLPPP